MSVVVVCCFDSTLCPTNNNNTTQDTLLGCKLVTQRDTFITREVMMNILMNIQVRPCGRQAGRDDVWRQGDDLCRRVCVSCVQML